MFYEVAMFYKTRIIQKYGSMKICSSITLASGLAAQAEDLYLRGPGFDSCEGPYFCAHEMLDRCRRITSKEARSKGLL